MGHGHEDVPQHQAEASTGEHTEGAPEVALFPLQVDEVTGAIQVKEAGRLHTGLLHTFKTPRAEDWLEFDRMTRLVLESDEGTMKTDSLVAEATEWLWLECIKGVSGYGKLPEDWRELIPLKHKEAALNAISQVEHGQDQQKVEGYTLGVEQEMIELEAARSGVVYKGLLHSLRKPNSAQQKEFSRVTGQTTYVRGQRKGTKALINSNFGFLLKLYDALIVSVEGYEPNEPRVMDATHKQIAVQLLMGNL